MTAPDPQVHRHKGDEYPNKPLYCYPQNPGEEPLWVQVGTVCPFCGFTPGPVYLRMRLEVEMGWNQTEEAPEPPEPVQDW